MSVIIPFTKMVGTGNDFLLVDVVHNPLPSLKQRWPEVARAMCDRRYGVGADGVLLLEPPRDSARRRRATTRMRIFNPDGSEAEMCGNGARCVIAFASGRCGTCDCSDEGVSVETAAGVLHGRVLPQGRVEIEMPQPRDLRPEVAVTVGNRRIEAGFVNTGVPHLVVPVKQLDRVDVQALGRALRTHRAFQPAGANVDFIEVASKRADAIRVRTYERGVEGETLACGTGITASAILHAVWQHGGRSGHNGGSSPAYRVTVEARSKELLTVSLRLQGHGSALRVHDVRLTGAVRRICEGQYAWSPQRLARRPSKAARSHRT